MKLTLPFGPPAKVKGRRLLGDSALRTHTLERGNPPCHGAVGLRLGMASCQPQCFYDARVN